MSFKMLEEAIFQVKLALLDKMFTPEFEKELLENLEVEFDKHKKGYVCIPRKQLEEINLATWLDQNYPNERNKEWNLYGANFIKTLRLFIDKELLGDSKKKE